MKNKRFAKTVRYAGLVLREDPRLGWVALTPGGAVVANAGSKALLKSEIEGHGIRGGRSVLAEVGQ